MIPAIRAAAMLRAYRHEATERHGLIAYGGEVSTKEEYSKEWPTAPASLSVEERLEVVRSAREIWQHGTHMRQASVAEARAPQSG